MASVRRALVVGIDGYVERPLTRCCDDARRVADALSMNTDGSRNWFVEPVLARDPEVMVLRRGDLAKRLADFFGPASAGDDLLFYFSGHTIVSPWGVELATQESVEPASGVPFGSLLGLISNSKASSVTVILDCCHAGAFASDNSGDPFSLSASHLPANVTVLAASHEDVAAIEASPVADFTELLISGLEGAAADLVGRVNAVRLFSFIHTAMWDLPGRPQIKANTSRLPVLRKARPVLREAEFAQLTRYFSSPDELVRLDPEYEHEVRQDDVSLHTAKQRDMAYFRKLRDAHLLEGVDADLYWAALDHGFIRLTPLGKYYWGLVYRGLM